MPSPETHTVHLTPGNGESVALDITRWHGGGGGPFLVLHGGAGPQSVLAFGELLADVGQAEVIAPTHPGFGGTLRPGGLDSVGALAELYSSMLDHLGLDEVTVIGNSMGGWVAAELALRNLRRVDHLVLVDAVGIDVPGHPVADPSELGIDEIVARSFHDPDRFRMDPAALPPAARALQASNLAALAAYSGVGSDAGLRARLQDIAATTLVLQGESDRIVDLGYAQTYADTIPRARLHVLAATGHVPQLETPEHVVAVVLDFVTTLETRTDVEPRWSAQHVVTTDVAGPAVWATLQDVYTGTRLTDHADTIEIQGPFAAGSRLTVRPDGADFAVPCEIVELVPGERYAYEATFDGLRLLSRHTLRRDGTGPTVVTHYQQIAGPGAVDAGPALGARITADTAATMTDLLAAAGSRPGPSPAEDA